MQRNVYIDGRLTDWAEWKVGDSGYRGISFESDGCDAPRTYIDYTPDQDEACLEMDLAIAKLPPELKRTVIAVYTWQGGMSVVTQRLSVTRATIHRRLCNADIRLDDCIATRRELAKKYQRRV